LRVAPAAICNRTRDTVAPMNTLTQDIVLLLGAGFSADADLPVMGKFGQQKQPRLAQDRRPWIAKFANAARTYESFRKHCIDRGALSIDRADNIEDVFSLAEVLAEAGHAPLPLGGANQECRDVVADIKLWIWKVYHQLPFYNKSERKPKDHTYDGFFALINELQLSQRIAVITTNYDIVFEWKAWQHDLCCSYPVSSTHDFRVSSGEGRFIAPIIGCPRPVIPVYKLHGSINYFTLADGGDDVQVAGDITERGGRVLNTGTTPDRPAIMYIEALEAVSRRYSDQLMPAIVPPTYAKLGHGRWLESIWNGALNALKHARLVVAIGYSMPDSDGFMKALIKAAIATRHSNEPPQLRIINDDPDVHTRFCKAFGKDLVIKTDPKRLDEALPELLPRLFESVRG